MTNEYTGIILAAGKSSRLKKKLKIKSKIFVKINNNKDSLDYNLLILNKAKILKVFINTHKYHKDYLSKFKNNKYKCSINLINEKKLLGTAGAISNIYNNDHNVDKVIILYGDNISNINLNEIIKRHKTNKSDFSVVINKKKDAINSGVVSFDKNLVIKSFKEKPKLNKNVEVWANSGIYLTNRKTLSKIDTKYKDFARDIIPELLIMNEVKVKAIKTKNKIYTIDNIDQLKNTKKKIKF
jgi:mannose-1-phosphate guanylyltransferase / phosphomannomutase|tara:strand:+ start:2638 stop:3357 length:720 start_codon:yes stop_codon:yes gene_type:complete